MKDMSGLKGHNTIQLCRYLVLSNHHIQMVIKTFSLGLTPLCIIT